MQASGKVIINTTILYGKMVVSIVVGLIITRITLQTLGAEDYGLYNVIAGVVSMLSVLNASMAAATQRYLSFNLELADSKNLYAAFNASIILHILFAITIIVLIETFGGYCVYNILSINPDKVNIAIKVLHCLSASIFFTVIAAPYTAVFIARENMLTLSIIEICEMLIKLCGVCLLIITSLNKLIFYAMVITITSALSFAAKAIIATKKYPEALISLKRLDNIQLFNEMLRFASWHTFAAVGSIGRNQGLAMILNIFGGVIVNAAYGITNQVNGLVQFFATAMQQAIRPQIIKSEGVGDRKRVKKLSLIACKYMYLLCAIVAIPLLLEMKQVLTIWLTIVPEYTVVFCRLTLISTMLLMLSVGLVAALDAVGKVKWVYITIGLLHILNIPFAYMLLKLGCKPYSAFMIVAIEEVICLFVRIYLSKHIVGISYNSFTNKVIVPSLIVTCSALVVGCIIKFSLEPSVIRTLITTTACIFTTLFSMYMCGMDHYERCIIINIFRRIFKKNNQ